MKHIILYISAVSLLSFSCNKQLDIKPEAVFTESMTLSTANTAEALLADAYYKTYQASVGSSMNGMGHLLGDACTGITDIGVTTTAIVPYITNAQISTDPNLATLWNSTYTAINEANVLINGLGNQSWPQANQFIAEAKFIRAYNYFRLYCLFGDGALNNQPDKACVPLQLKSSTGYDPSQVVVRNKNSEVYAQILKDLDEAATVLTNNETDNLKLRSRAQKATCWALASRVALYAGDNEKAISYSNQVIQQTARYSLLSSPLLTFPDNGALTTSSNYPIPTEWIFCFPVSYNTNLTDIHVIGYYFKTTAYANSFFVNNYPANDLRKTMFVAGGNITNTGVGLRLCPVKFSAGSGKSTLPTRNPVATNAMRDNLVVLRLAEMYLNNAEAQVKMSGVTQNAVDMLNAVHKRSIPTTYTVGSFPTADSLLHVILRERRWEFAYEGVDRYDQIRIANLQNLPPDLGIKNLNPAFANAQKWVLPIPNSEVLLSNYAITQNPGY